MSAERRTIKKRPATRKQPASRARARPNDDASLFDATAEVFGGHALSTSKGLRAADRTLEKVRGCTAFIAADAWMRRAVGLYRLPAPPGLDADRHAVFIEAGRLLLQLARPDSGDYLVELLAPGAMKDPGPHRYVVYLLGRLGRPEHVPAASEWYRRQTARDVSRVGFPTFNAMADLFIRLQSRAVLAHLQGVLADQAAGKILLTRNHRYAYEAAADAILNHKPATFGLVPLPDPA